MTLLAIPVAFTLLECVVVAASVIAEGVAVLETTAVAVSVELWLSTESALVIEIVLEIDGVSYTFNVGVRGRRDMKIEGKEKKIPSENCSRQLVYDDVF